LYIYYLLRNVKGDYANAPEIQDLKELRLIRQEIQGSSWFPDPKEYNKEEYNKVDIPYNSNE
jgi:hypothetical protein